MQKKIHCSRRGRKLCFEEEEDKEETESQEEFMKTLEED
jgi:hypothetical protein